MNKPKIVLVASESDQVDVYLKSFQVFDLELHTVPNITDLVRLLSREPFNGIVIDLKTKLKASHEEKELAYDVLEQYPVMQSRLILPSGKVQSMPVGKARKEVTIEDFFTRVCVAYQARKIRSDPRKSLNFNILLSRDGRFSVDAVERTFTINISRGGCFVPISSEWSIGQHVAFIIKELEDRTPIVGEIRWCVPWGKRLTVPGIGIKFEDIQKGQLNQLIEQFGL
ncbi:MAG: PilZ domain-containing protein [Desulfatitalea sp.]|nr:PilZ domain-containing protein [Desulfatitalea sp.]NNJ98918.1 PilZ domain-containing protein [Desulfatitalea sp.]